MFDFYAEWKAFSVTPDDWLVTSCHAALCANERHCTVANAARRILTGFGYDVETWVMAIIDDNDIIVGHRLTVKVFLAGKWRLFYWLLGPIMHWVASQNNENRSVPPGDITESMKVVGSSRVSEIRGEQSPEAAEARRAGIQEARHKKELKRALGAAIVRSEARQLSGSGKLVTLNPARIGETAPDFWAAKDAAANMGWSVSDCVKAYNKSLVPTDGRRGGLGWPCSRSF